MLNVLLTGIPRSGLTVVCALLDTLPGCVSLNEPAWQKTKSSSITEPVPYCKWLAGDFLWQRQRLLAQDPVRDFRDKDGKPLLDSMFDPRRLQNETGEISNVFFTRPDLVPDFNLIIKQHALFTALLPQLVKFDMFKIIVVIRHPFDVIQSWQKLKNHPLSEGKLETPTNWWPEVEEISTMTLTKLERMTRLYDTFCKLYYELKDSITILKYEDVMKDPAHASRAIDIELTPPGITLLEERPRVLIKEQTDEIRSLLARNGLFTKHFYPV